MLQITPDLEDDPGARATIEIAAALVRVGAQALVAARGGRLVPELQARGGLFTPFPADAANPLSLVLNVRRLARLARTERVDLVHARSRGAAWSARGATRLVKIPFVTSFQSAYARGGPLALRYGSVMAEGDAVIVGSTAAAQELARLYPAAARRAHVVVGGVDCRQFSPRGVAPLRVQAARRLWEAPPDARLALVAARDAEDARPALSAFRRLAEAGDPCLAGVRIVLVLEGADAGLRAQAALKAAGLQGAGRGAALGDDRPAALLAAAAVVTATRDLEAYCALALEAEAMGAAVLTAGDGAAAESILAPPETDAARRTGWRVPLDDADGFAAALREALSLGASARDRLSLRARAHVETRFSMERMWTQTLDAYASALALHEAAQASARRR
ncbi:glycosyltransferase [Methylocella sp.]|uniref:glycosyltransferase n=1 Tax=Methylocella sp. TaxID=1978226 RepID=UPI003782F371